MSTISSPTPAVMNDIKLIRLGILMEADPSNELEAEGVLNPAAVRGKDGQLYLFPRLVAKGNYSRIGIARVKFNESGDPVGVERLGIALEPKEEYELRSDGGGGCEDPRVTYLEPVGHYVMSYVALSDHGPRIALARSMDLIHWDRLGLACFSPFEHIRFDEVPNKDSCCFPTTIPNAEGRPALGMMHRPLFPGTRPEETRRHGGARTMDLHRECIWISYCAFPERGALPTEASRFTSHHRLAVPAADWEALKIGVGAPPVLTDMGWLVIYHGVCETGEAAENGRKLSYSAGLMILNEDDPTKILYRSPHPILSPELPEERQGAVANVVFPTGLDRRDDLGQPNRFDVYYGMADDRIGVARLDLPETLLKG